MEIIIRSYYKRTIKHYANCDDQLTQEFVKKTYEFNGLSNIKEGVEYEGGDLVTIKIMDITEEGLYGK